jgi:hypothetical protein
LAEHSDCMVDINNLMNQMRKRILDNEVLSKIHMDLERDNSHLIEQYGGITVELGIRIIEAYRCLDQLVIRLQNKSQKI